MWEEKKIIENNSNHVLWYLDDIWDLKYNSGNIVKGKYAHTRRYK